MSISILTPYKLFFTTQADILYALMKDGRILKIKQIPYFSNLSSDRTMLCGIFFDGENTHIMSSSLGVDSFEKKEIASLFGYFYYPCLSKTGKMMAIIEADLLKPKPQGELQIYIKKIKRWYLQKSLPAKMKSPFLSSIDESVFFIDEQSNLCKLLGDNKTVLAIDVLFFALSASQTKIVYYNGSIVYVYSLLNRAEITSFPATNLTALCFDATENEILFSVSQDNRYAIYSQNYKTNKTVLLAQPDESVVLISS
ncbi:MAG: hypothetical protein E7013_00390 [Alphaproteobacteria bacterium]|nr:hypothetical protein [Alphaproteobacteria bacterium]